MAKEFAGKGRKTCPNCGEIIGARSSVCPKCQHQFTPKAGRRHSARPDRDPFKVIESVKEFGGVAEVKKQLAAVAKLRKQAEAIEEKLKPLGGVAGAEQSLQLIEALEAALRGK